MTSKIFQNLTKGQRAGLAARFILRFLPYMRGGHVVCFQEKAPVSGSESDAAHMKNIHCESSENDGKIWTARNSLATAPHSVLIRTNIQY
jgi:hypothetical protein